MTDPRMTSTNDAPVTVEQCDWEAVQAFHRKMLDRLMSDVKSDRPKLGEDEGDAGTLVQAFARHRLAALASAPAGDAFADAGKPIAADGDGVEAVEILAQAFERAGDKQSATWVREAEANSKLRKGYCTPLHMEVALDAIAAALARPRAAVAIDADMLGEVMQGAWGEICDDAGAHPSDMTHGRGSVLFYSPNHWTRLIAMRLSERLNGPRAAVGEQSA